MTRIGRGRWRLVVTVLAAMGCTHNVMPKVVPEKVPAVQPPIASRALLLLSPSFEMYGVQESNGIHKWRYHLGESMAAGLADLVAKSFVEGQTRRVSDEEVLRRLSGARDTVETDLLLVPHFEEGGMTDRFFTTQAEARVRLDVRSLRSGRTYSWRGEGRKASAFQSMKGLTGNAIERALQAMSDTLAAHRAELEGRGNEAAEPAGS